LVASTLALTSSNGLDFFHNGGNVLGTSPAFSGFLNGPDGNPSQIQLLGTIQTASGGSVLVLAPRILQQGTIVAPNGQVVLAAGESVWLYTDNNNTSTRGYMVEFKADSTTTLANALNRSGVVNTGTISADHGNVTLAALAINQQGNVSASSAALLNGSVWLLAKEGVSGEGSSLSQLSSPRTGVVTLAPGSTTGTPLDANDTTTLAQGQSYTPYQGQVKITGQQIDIGGSVLSPGGNIQISASDPQTSGPGTSRIYLEPGAVVSAAGDWVNLPLSAELISVHVTSNELANSPMQKGGILQGATVTVNANIGTTLFDASQYIANVQQSVQQKAATGGSVTLFSQGDVIARPGSLIDVSGGGFLYPAGRLYTTQLVANGVLYDIGSAPANLRYSDIIDSFTVTYPRWGVTHTFTLAGTGAAPYRPADVVGQAGGTLSINAFGGAVLEGSLKGGVTAGRTQFATSSFPAAATLDIGDPAFVVGQQFSQSIIDLALQAPVLAADFTAATPAGSTSLTPLPSSLAGKVVLPAAVFGSGAVDSSGYFQQPGFGTVKLYSADSISVPVGMQLTLAPGGSLTLGSGAVNMNGRISIRGGSVSLLGLQTQDVSLPSVSLGPAASVDVDGYWINNTPAGAAAGSAQLPSFINGGSIRVGPLPPSTSSSSYAVNVSLAAGSVLDASGGALLSGTNSSLTAGNGGSIAISASDGQGSSAAGSLSIGATLSAYGIKQGGSLQITGGNVVLGGGSAASGQTLLPASLLANGGFGTYTIGAVSSLEVPAGAIVQPIMNTLVLPPNPQLIASGGKLGDFAAVGLLPDFQRPAANLALNTVNSGATLTIERGASISTDVGGKVTVTGQDNLSVFGSISAPAGSIALTLKAPTPPSSAQQAESLLVGDGALLSARGVFVPQPSSLGQVLGNVLAGGTISLTGSKAGVQVTSGATLDVSGASAAIDLPLGSGGAAVQRTQIWGNAGTISVNANYGISLLGNFVGQAQGTGAGGSLAVTLLKIDPTGTTPGLVELPHRLVLSQSASGLGAPSSSYVEGFLPVGGLAANGFDKLQLAAGDGIAFRGNVSLALARELDVDSPNVAADPGTRVALSAPQVSFGGSNVLLNVPGASSPAGGTPLPGSATLDVSAAGGLIQLFGYTRLDGFAGASFESAGDIRLAGVPAIKPGDSAIDSLQGWLNTSGNLTLQATQVYPTSFSQFGLAATGAASVLRIDSNGAPALPALSANGSVTLAANVIQQFGTLVAPLGQIAINAAASIELGPGSVTSVSGSGLLIPYGGTLSGQSWNYLGIPINQAPAKQIALSAANIAVDPRATVNLSGGGDVYGVEFLPGPGGSTDYLASSGVYVVLPQLR
ncbi:MAG: hypothetical protein JO021_16925, partial [Alphaproteobacteria bacterium]|nr:hypothetical protein [Alphaproteobacteria bacterium]